MNGITKNRMALALLARLCGGGDKGVTAAALRKDLGPWLGGSPSAGEQDTAIAQLADGLAAQKLARREQKGKTVKWIVREEGVAAAQETLHLPTPLPKWPAIRDVYLLGQALGVAPETEADIKWIKSSGNLQGAVIAQAHGVQTPPKAAKKVVIEQLLWKQIGIETDAPFTIANVKLHLLRQVAGVSRAAYTPAQLENLLAAQAAGARRSTPAALRAALLQDWLAAEHTPATVGAEPAPVAPAPPAEDGQVAEFAEEVLETALAMDKGIYGDDLAFIAAAHEAWQQKHAHTHDDLADFKKQLLAAYKAGHLQLVRADLVEAMPADLVAASEVTYLNSVLHFIRLKRNP